MTPERQAEARKLVGLRPKHDWWNASVAVCECGHTAKLVEGQCASCHDAAYTAELRALLTEALDALVAREREIEALRADLDAYDYAADKFIEKVRSGRAQSRETYADMLACRARTQQTGATR